jgi:hypothetical protein
MVIRRMMTIGLWAALLVCGASLAKAGAKSVK